MAFMASVGVYLVKFLQEKAVEATKQNEEKRKKPKPMPQRQDCPYAKRHGNRNPEYHEEQQKDVA
jgi:hypothetical protein